MENKILTEIELIAKNVDLEVISDNDKTQIDHTKSWGFKSSRTLYFQEPGNFDSLVIINIEFEADIDLSILLDEKEIDMLILELNNLKRK